MDYSIQNPNLPAQAAVNPEPQVRQRPAGATSFTGMAVKIVSVGVAVVAASTVVASVVGLVGGAVAGAVSGLTVYGASKCVTSILNRAVAVRAGAQPQPGLRPVPQEVVEAEEGAEDSVRARSIESSAAPSQQVSPDPSPDTSVVPSQQPGVQPGIGQQNPPLVMSFPSPLQQPTAEEGSLGVQASISSQPAIPTTPAPTFVNNGVPGHMATGVSQSPAYTTDLTLPEEIAAHLPESPAPVPVQQSVENQVPSASPNATEHASVNSTTPSQPSSPAAHSPVVEEVTGWQFVAQLEELVRTSKGGIAQLEELTMSSIQEGEAYASRLPAPKKLGDITRNFPETPETSLANGQALHEELSVTSEAMSTLKAGTSVEGDDESTQAASSMTSTLQADSFNLEGVQNTYVNYFARHSADVDAETDSEPSPPTATPMPSLDGETVFNYRSASVKQEADTVVEQETKESTPLTAETGAVLKYAGFDETPDGIRLPRKATDSCDQKDFVTAPELEMAPELEEWLSAMKAAVLQQEKHESVVPNGIEFNKSDLVGTKLDPTVSAAMPENASMPTTAPQAPAGLRPLSASEVSELQSVLINPGDGLQLPVMLDEGAILSKKLVQAGNDFLGVPLLTSTSAPKGLNELVREMKKAVASTNEPSVQDLSLSLSEGVLASGDDLEDLAVCISDDLKGDTVSVQSGRNDELVTFRYEGDTWYRVDGGEKKEADPGQYLMDLYEGHEFQEQTPDTPPQPENLIQIIHQKGEVFIPGFNQVVI